jgi:hypothetical protein
MLFKRSRKTWVGLLAFALWVPVSCALAQIVEHRSVMFVLVDLSETWHRPDTLSRNEALLQHVSKGVVELASRTDRPAYVAFIGIGDQSLGLTPICEATYHPTLLQGSKKQVLQKPAQLATFLEACSKASLSRPTAKWTDISGALDLMRRQLGDEPKATNRFAIILSDMKEERKSKIPIEASLKDFRMVVAYRVLPEDDRDPKAFNDRLTHWREKLKRWGGHVTMIVDTGLVGPTIADMARKK